MTDRDTTPRALEVDRLLDDPRTRFIVCCGSGGVGKTPTAAALGLRAAAASWAPVSAVGRTMLIITAPSWSPPSARPRSSASPSSVSCTGISSSTVTK